MPKLSGNKGDWSEVYVFLFSQISEKKRAINKYVSNVSERIFVHE